MKWTEEQRKALERMTAFVSRPGSSVFILKGFAGTGKTTLLRAFLHELEEKDIDFELMAPTGRAAKVLREKTGYPASTIHKAIYEFKEKEERKNQLPILHYQIRQSSSRVFIVDEASMVSSRENLQEIYRMGTDRLLPDLLTYASVQEDERRRLIFVGDPAQLPPVGEPHSPALDRLFFETEGLRVEEAMLTEVIRQSEGSLILDNAMRMRDLIFADRRSQLTLTYDKESFIPIDASDMTPIYQHLYPKSTDEGGVMIAYSNRTASELNQEIRKRYFDNTTLVQPGDRLIVVANNDLYDLVNGDFITVRKVYPKPEIHHIPLGKQRVTLSFRTIFIEGREEGLKIHEGLLYNAEPRLGLDELKALYVKLKIEYGERIPIPIYQTDPYFNALQCKFGYAVTCHKAQGGEWDTILVDYAGRNTLNEDCLRWCYTATTRAVRHCYVVHPPERGLADTFEVLPTTRFTKAPALPHVSGSDESETLPDPPGDRLGEALPGVKKKYADLARILPREGFEILSVRGLQYMERYTVRDCSDGRVITLEGSYKKDGTFHQGFSVTTPECPPELSERLRQLFDSNPDREKDGTTDYHPGSEAFELVYGVMCEATDSCSITIRAVEELPDHYYVQYYLSSTDTPDSYLRFFVDGEGRLKKLMPFSRSGSEDQRLNNLLDEIRKNLCPTPR